MTGGRAEGRTDRQTAYSALVASRGKKAK